MIEAALGLSREELRRKVFALNFSLKARHKRNFRALDVARAQKLAEATYAYYRNTSDEGDLVAALQARLDEDRSVIIPWIDAAFPLDGARVLEIGCGTGESTLALAEQGARVTGVDVDPGAQAVARERLRLHGLAAEFHEMNAIDCGKTFAGRTFDIVVFFAALEHMTLEERLVAMRDTWGLLRPGGIWMVVEAPNRLWFWDGHTSMDNFYNWLPDEVASRWAHRGARKAFADALPKDAPFDPLHVARWGRGVSFHEFDLAFGDARSLDVVSNKRDFLLRSNPLLFAWSLFSKTRRYERFLEGLEPRINPGFFRQYLDLIIRKR
jgi:S-adenosylmethionine-dependent methyltransferase